VPDWSSSDHHTEIRVPGSRNRCIRGKRVLDALLTDLVALPKLCPTRRTTAVYVQDIVAIAYIVFFVALSAFMLFFVWKVRAKGG
jgi:hypothetical protein